MKCYICGKEITEEKMRCQDEDGLNHFCCEECYSEIKDIDVLQD